MGKLLQDSTKNKKDGFFLVNLCPPTTLYLTNRIPANSVEEDFIEFD